MLNQTEQILSSFEMLEAKHPGCIEHSLTFDFGRHTSHIVISAIVHGNEVGCLPGIMRVIQELESEQLVHGGKVTFILGNVAAAQKGKRYIDEDLNRAFIQLNGDSLSVEKQRAKEIASILDTADIYIDFHQTNEILKEPFVIFHDNEYNHRLVRYLGVAAYGVTIDEESVVSTSKRTSIEYCAASGIPGFAIECFQAGYSTEAEDITYKTITRLIDLHDGLQKKSNALGENPACEPLLLLKIIAKQPFRDRGQHLRPCLENLRFINKGEVVGLNEDGSDLLMPADGFLMFPKYPERDVNGAVVGELPSDIFLIANKY